MISLRKMAFVAAALSIFSGRPCYAPTDWVVNTLDYANGLVKDASAVQEEYAGYANTYIQGKVGELGDVNAAKKKTEKAKKLKDTAAKYKEKAKKVQALADKAKEKKAALQEKADKLQEKADRIKQKYEAAQAEISKARDKINDVKDKVDEAKDKIDDAKDMYDQAKNTVDMAKDEMNQAQEAVSGLKETTAGTLGTAGAAVDAAQEKNDLEAFSAAEDEGSPDAEEDVTYVEPEKGISAVSAVTPIQAMKPNAAAALQELTTVDNAVVTDISLPVMTAREGLNTELSADDVLKMAETPDNEIAAAAETVSEFNLEEQLLMADRLKAKERAENAAPKLSNEELRGRLRAGDEAKLEALRQSRRKSFGTAPAAVKEVDHE